MGILCDSSNSHCLPGQKDTTEEWETLTESCLETAVKLRILPELMDPSQMSVHVMDEMSQAAVNGENSRYHSHELSKRCMFQTHNKWALYCKGKRNNDTLSAAFMSYYHKFMEQKKVYGDCYIDDIKANQRVDSTECSVLDNAWSSGMCKPKHCTIRCCVTPHYNETANNRHASTCSHGNYGCHTFLTEQANCKVMCCTL